RVDAEVQGEVDRLVELGRGGLLDQLEGRLHLVDLAAVHEGVDLFYALGDGGHVQMPSTSTPMLRALPAIVRTAASRSAAVRSGCLVLAISSACLRVSLPTLSVCGLLLPFSSLSALRIRTDAGGDFRLNVKLLSA